MKYSESLGRYFVATRDIAPGDTVYEETPYVASLDLESFYMMCSQCLKLLFTCIPCNRCMWLMFCSEKCKEEAWIQYHDVECGLLTHMVVNQINDLIEMQACIRALIKGVKEAGSIEALKANIEEIDNYNGNGILMFFFNLTFFNTFSSCHNCNFTISYGALHTIA